MRGRTLDRRQMYSDILFNGSRRFAVPVSHPETGRLASVAPVFYLEDLKEVSEQTQDAVKYVCSHKVIGRVRIKRTLNDRVWADRSTYLKAVVEPLEDGDDDEAGRRDTSNVHSTPLHSTPHGTASHVTRRRLLS